MEVHYDYDDTKNNCIVHSKFIKNNETIIHEYIDNICGNHHRIEECDGKYYLTLGGNTIASYDYGELCHIINNYEYEMKIKELKYITEIETLSKRKERKRKVNAHFKNILKTFGCIIGVISLIAFIIVSYIWPIVILKLSLKAFIIFIINGAFWSSIYYEFLPD